MTRNSGTPTFWTTVWLLLKAAGRRSGGRRKRTQQLLRNRSSQSTDWGPLAFFGAIVFIIVLNVTGAMLLVKAVNSGVRIEAQRQGKIFVSGWFLDAVHRALRDPSQDPDEALAPLYSSEARRIARKSGDSEDTTEEKLRDAVRQGGENLLTEDDTAFGLAVLSRLGVVPEMLGSIVLLWWGAMLVFQGEGLELDLQRRRHPMWEWLFSHPVPAGAVFLAEMLSPIAANPVYWGAPLFVGVLYGFAYDPGLGFVATLLVGVPVTIAAACMGKALEIGVILRFPPRSRGAMIGLMGWLGYASMMLLFLGAFIVRDMVPAVWKYLDAFTLLPWPWLKLFLGASHDGSFSFFSGMFTCWIAASITIAGAVWFSVWGTQQGLSGNVRHADTKPSVPKGGTGFVKDPLYRKEFLWFVRDRSAIVQTILIPLTVASVQLFNLRAIVKHANGAWNYLCGTAILFGTYFLWVLGPKSLASEGTALWIALTWPRGLESLLKAKAWLWSLISSGMVGLVLCYAAFLFPADMWKIMLIGIGWFFFGRSMAEKTVTLVTVTSSSGESEKIPWERRAAAQLGMLTFSIGVLTQQWPLAVVGIVYSYITAAAMWESFRARLPYLYDPWSETVPAAPTLMHAMVAISLLVEGGAIFSGIVSAADVESRAIAQAIAYAICAIAVSIGVANFLSNRGVSLGDICRWQTVGRSTILVEAGSGFSDNETGKFSLLLVVGAGAGLLLGLFAHGYLALLQHFPATAEIIHRSQEQMAKVPNLRISYGVMAVAFAPFTEEYLFRGLLYRALDREWGGWRAVVGSAAFFAIYHPPLSWLPVGLLGITSALVFKKTRQLAPSVVLHVVYNAVVLM